LQKPVLGDRHSKAVTVLHLTASSVLQPHWRNQIMANKVASLVRNASLPPGIGWRRGTLSFIDSLIQKGYAQKSRAMRYTVVRGLK